ncbi:D-3-phosphoglycerate dehydrogenase 3, chloroplastic-like protein [Drosera capensis]
MVPPEVLSELAPYVRLAEKLGRLAVQLVAGGDGIEAVKVVYNTARSPDDLDTRLLRAMITKGIIEPISDTFINLVNADLIGKQRGLRISEVKAFSESSSDYPVDNSRAPSRHDRAGGQHPSKYNVNVSFLSVGRTGRGKKGIMAIGVDEEPNKESLEEIGHVQAIEESVFLKL